MIILGAGGHAKEVIEVLKLNNFKEQILLFDDVTLDKDWPEIFKGYRRLRTIKELKEQFITTPEFIIGVGGIKAKSILWEKAISAGGQPCKLIANNASLSDTSNIIDIGVSVMQMALISPDVKLGKGVMINTRANIHHDVSIGEFSEVAPSAILLGKCTIGKNTFIGAGAIILPNIEIGDNCIIGAGSVVTKNFRSYSKVKGNPAK
ncbi:MAG: NeuD/PglB/VioB family sugar acetyltransferase [Carboxylicivirga sp.]|jgi:sugar O-acyltransferase (sialic acid O-acetyltransferase NeuD family)|nr:NeuD/PglB/VioB family sugar acetyltransferase [Carboxylicivirga sp.]